MPTPLDHPALSHGLVDALSVCRVESRNRDSWSGRRRCFLNVGSRPWPVAPVVVIDVAHGSFDGVDWRHVPKRSLRRRVARASSQRHGRGTEPVATTETGKATKTKTETQRERGRERERERERYGDGHGNGNRDRDRDRNTDGKRQKCKQIGRQTDGRTGRPTERQRQAQPAIGIITWVGVARSGAGWSGTVGTGQTGKKKIRA